MNAMEAYGKLFAGLRSVGPGALGLVLLLGGCGQEAAQPPPGESANLRICEEPRPEICTADYDPVCGTLDDGSRQTFSNGCNACSNPRVKGFEAKACPE